MDIIPHWAAVMYVFFHNLNWCFTAVNIQTILWMKSISDNILKTKAWFSHIKGHNVVIANLVQTQLRLSPDRSRTFQLASTYLRRTLNLSSFYLPSTLPLFCIYQKTKKSTFSTIMNFELSIVNSKSSELWIVILRWTFPLASPLLPPYYHLTTFLLSPYYPLTIGLLQFLFSTFTELPQHIANI